MSMLEPDIETLDWQEQQRQDDVLYRRQIAFLLENSRFYRQKLTDAGFPTADAIGGLADIARLPMTEKDDLRATRTEADPIGTHLAVPMSELARIYSTSGTTGTPSYIPLTAGDLDNWVRTSARSYAASGVEAGQAIVSTYNAGPFVAGSALDAFNRIGLCHIPVGTGNTERLMAAITRLHPQALVCTPSYALHLAEWARERGIDLPSCSVQRILVAGEPGGGEAAMRGKLEEAWGATVTEAMGIGDIGASLWGECEEQQGMHFCARGFVHIELIDPETGEAVPMEDGATGELVYTHLAHRAAPLLRFRSRDHVMIRTETCACGRTSPRVRCIGRTDDMLIVRGVNVFPSAIREVVNEFAPAVTGVISVRPGSKGVKQAPPLKVLVELTDGDAPDGLADRIRQRVRDTLVVTTSIELVAAGALPRSEYKSKLIDYSEAS
ncbi:phenylacetate--CoA ligase family protein [Amorphus orientalis]|uniref:Phenylacetate-CoA ligase n=1 Tax=Amorphus orientalis TaxID=649198 RepID=A0AAE3VJZ2_9HYPH|nr:AMP-binding protein [Amorphus orientalis]MDQ0313749.1 phenylacetate-CoA ligase [Amorphus orientalis]